MSEFPKSKRNQSACVVCGNNSVISSDKKFFAIPMQTSRRRKWLIAIKKSRIGISGRDKKHYWKRTGSIFCCEDHFSLKEDTINWAEHQVTGEELSLKKDVVPHIFHHVDKWQSCFENGRRKSRRFDVRTEEIQANCRGLEIKKYKNENVIAQESGDSPSESKVSSRTYYKMSQTAHQWKGFKGNNLPSERNNYRNHDNSRPPYYRHSYNMPHHFHYFQNNFHHYHRPQFRRRYNQNKLRDKKPVHPLSPLCETEEPLCGTEEYTLKKIQETSDMIKKQLLMPPEMVEASKSAAKELEKCEFTPEESTIEKVNVNSVVRNRKVVAPFDVSEIHTKIMSHISNLSHGKKINLICSSSSGYDVAIQQIQKQSRLEISTALRDMALNQTLENAEIVNSIIPDIGIKIEHLPLEVIRQLSKTLDDDLLFESHINTEFKTETVDQEEKLPEVLDNFLNLPNQDTLEVPIKMELIESNVDEVSNISNVIADHFVEEGLFGDIEVNANLRKTSSVHTQTDGDQLQLSDNDLNPTCLQEALSTMFRIDDEIARLTKLRQLVFSKLEKTKVCKSDKRVLKKRKGHNSYIARADGSEDNKGENADVNEVLGHENVESGLNRDFTVIRDSAQDNRLDQITVEAKNSVQTKNRYYEKELVLGPTSEKILVIKVVGNKLLAGAESGNLFYIDLLDGLILRTIRVTSTPITALVLTGDQTQLNMFIGSYETQLKQYNFENGLFFQSINVSDSIQCLDVQWNYIFIGTFSGNLIRYSLKKNITEYEDRICPSGVLVLKATQEGARRVLLVGARNSPVCVRDAMSGLHMRTMNCLISPTVYSLLLENSLVYCGTTLHDILVFSFHDGTLVHKHHASNAKGIGCMKLVGNLLFASCHNGNIYVFHSKQHKYIGMIPGPGGVILSMEIVFNLVIVGTMSFNFKSILIPNSILESND